MSCGIVVALQHQRLDEKHAANSQKLLLSNCRLEDKGFQALAQLWSQSLYSEKEVSMSVQGLLKAPGQPSDLAKAVLGNATVQLPGLDNETEAPIPAWLSALCWGRTHFVHSTLVWGLGGEHELALVFVFALSRLSAPKHTEFGTGPMSSTS